MNHVTNSKDTTTSMSPSSFKGRVYKQVGRLLLGPCGERASWMHPTGCNRQSWSAGKGTGASDINVETVVVYYRALPSRTIKIHKKKKKKKKKKNSCCYCCCCCCYHWCCRCCYCHCWCWCCCCRWWWWWWYWYWWPFIIPIVNN